VADVALAARVMLLAEVWPPDVERLRKALESFRDVE